ncbi:MAG: alkaline phosphatase family protein [Nannocystaceae bacterium]|nr:alkaline phosphatase family protein [Nannocystaceae bacterium]
MHRTLVLNVVGLTTDLLGPNTPNLNRLIERGAQASLETVTPALTCSVQSTFITGELPRGHGCVANGWYFRDLSQVSLWRQSNKLVQGEKLWDRARRRDGRFTVAKMFWWYNMYADVDYAVTPRPIYRADGRKLPDIHAEPGTLRNELQTTYGQFPLFEFWGPRAGIASSEWIAQAALHVHRSRQPTLNLVYLPHLDYNLQRLGPGDPKIAEDVRAIDAVCGTLIDEAERDDVRVVVLSEYGITAVSGAVHINRVLREAGLIAFREECGEEHFDAGASEAFAVADHQIGHVYVKNPGRVAEVKGLLEQVEGIETVLDDEGKRSVGLDHERSGELVAISKADRWFTYYFWLDDSRAPDYARNVDIHNKPGYDPVELFVDPKLPLPTLYVASRLFRSKVLNQRAPLDVIGFDTSLVRGSHGRPTDRPGAGPVFLTSEARLLEDDVVYATDVQALLLEHLFG